MDGVEQEIAKAASKLKAARDEHYRISKLSHSEKQAIKHRYEDVIAQECRQVDAKYQGELSVAQNLVDECKKALDILKVNRIQSSCLSGVPVGGKVFEWRRRGYTFTGRLDPTGVVGIVEVFTNASEVPANMVFGVPEVGELCVRVLKKNGSPSLRVVRANSLHKESDLPFGWYPEGVDPNKGGK